MSQIILNQETVENGSLAKFGEDSKNLIEQCGRVVVTDQESFGAVGDLVKIGRTKLKVMDEARLAETKKPRDYVSWLNKRFKALTDPLETALTQAGNKAAAWAKEEEKRRQEVERKAREKAEAEALELAAKKEAEEKLAREAAAEAQRQAQAAQDAADAAQAAARAAIRKGEEAEAEKQAQAAREAQDAARAARDAQDAAQEIAETHAAEAEQVLEVAAEAPRANTTVRKVRGTYGSSAGIRKTLKYEIDDLYQLVMVFQKAIMADDNAKKYMRIALDKHPEAKVFLDCEDLQNRVKRSLEDNDEVRIGGLRFYYDETFSAR